jgi:hypothetical protein
MRLSGRILLCLTVGAFACTASPATPMAEYAFDEFPATVVSIEKAAIPKVNASPKARRFRTALRTETAKGANFAGHFAFVTWGCGVACEEFAVVDALTGDVHFPAKLRVNAYQAVTDETPPLQFRIDSRLLILTGSPNDGTQPVCSTTNGQAPTSSS